MHEFQASSLNGLFKSGAVLLLIQTCPVRGRPLPAGSFSLSVYESACQLFQIQSKLCWLFFILQSPAHHRVLVLDHAIVSADSGFQTT